MKLFKFALRNADETRKDVSFEGLEKRQCKDCDIKRDRDMNSDIAYTSDFFFFFFGESLSAFAAAFSALRASFLAFRSSSVSTYNRRHQPTKTAQRDNP